MSPQLHLLLLPRQLAFWPKNGQKMVFPHGQGTIVWKLVCNNVHVQNVVHFLRPFIREGGGRITTWRVPKFSSRRQHPLNILAPLRVALSITACKAVACKAVAFSLVACRAVACRVVALSILACRAVACRAVASSIMACKPATCGA